MMCCDYCKVTHAFVTLPVLPGTRLGSVLVGACRMLRHRSPLGLQILPVPAGARLGSVLVVLAACYVTGARLGSKILPVLAGTRLGPVLVVLAACYVAGARLGSKILPVLAGTRLGSVRVGACRMLRHRSPLGLQFYRCLPAPAGVQYLSALAAYYVRQMLV